MVFLVRETLTEEDRAAWRQMRTQRDREARKKRRREVRDWFVDKLCSLVCAAMGAVMLYVVVSGGASAGYLLCIPFMLVGGVFGFVARGRFPVRKTELLPGEDFPPPDVVRAAFFGDGCFVFWDASEKVRLGYSDITSVWEDEGRFYLLSRDRPPLILPKRGFGRWMPEDFRDFLERELEWPVERIK